MILDDTLEFADATALDTGGTGRALVGDVVDLSVARDIGQHENQLYLVIQVETAPTSAGAATVEFILASDAQAAIATDGTATEHWKSKAFAIADLVKGYQIVVPLPLEDPAYERYLGVLQNVGTAALTAGKINAFITDSVQKNKSYADALSAP